MYPHQEETLQNTIAHFQKDPDVEALLLGGSIAHNFHNEGSDVDIMILIPEPLYEQKKKEGALTFFSLDLATYEGGYVDGKYISMSYIEDVAKRGSEPARFAFDGARVLFSKNDALEDALRRAAQFPAEGKADRLVSFAAQVEAWHWFIGEALKRENRYLQWLAIGKLVLFGGRLILAHNDMLYPFHKWFLRVLADAPDRPDGLMESIDALYKDGTAETAKQFHDLVAGFKDWGLDPITWGAHFMVDSELTWQTGVTPIDDL